MTKWYRDKKREHYYKQAKKVGYRARSAFKLLQIQKRFNILKQSDTVLDLGAAPGGWSQVAKKIVGDEGRVIGVDILPVKPVKDVVFLQGDMTTDKMTKEIEKVLGDDRVDVVISDMSPDISGNYDMDQARSVFLGEKALHVAKVFLKPSGNFVCKIFMGADLPDFLKKVEGYFSSVKRFSPDASRKSSSEIYIICKKFHLK